MPRSEELLLQAGTGLFVLAMVCYLLRLAVGRSAVGAVATASAWLGVAAVSAMLVVRGVRAGHVPLVSMFEYLSAFAWMVALSYLVFQWRYARAVEGTQAAGALALLFAVALLGYASTLPVPMKQAEDLMPVLKSNWLIFHVSVAVVGYGTACLASALACLYFVSHKVGDAPSWWRSRLPAAAVLDQAVYRSVRFAFPFLTLLNITGAVWAYFAWGRYWGWDPKETWSLITWLIYTFYLHARLRAGWRPTQTNAVVVAGIAAILFTFLGVNQLAAFSESLHSYAAGS